MMGSDLIPNVYKELTANNYVRHLIGTFIYGDCDDADVETMQDLVVYMT